MTIGLPRAFLYFRFYVLWRAFFKILGVPVVLSPATDRSILDRGIDLSTDEMCLSGKIYLGHVDALLNKCDKILVPRVSNFGFKRNMCTRFEAMPDMCRNIFFDDADKILTYNLDVLNKQDEKTAFLDLGISLGFDKKTVKKAYDRAKKIEQKKWDEKIAAENALYQKKGMKILIAAHNYVIEDPYLGKPVIEGLLALGAIPIRADIVNRKEAVKHALKISPTLKWQYNLEIVGGVSMHAKDVDGVVFLSAFPCGPDSMVNEIVMRRIKGVPMINLTLDGQSGTAGLETRLESFIDIIHFKEGTL